MTIDPVVLSQLQKLAADLIAYPAQRADARTWGGPTIYPDHPIDEDRAYRDGTALRELLTKLATGEA